jgi:hypothetical protein
MGILELASGMEGMHCVESRHNRADLVFVQGVVDELCVLFRKSST